MHAGEIKQHAVKRGFQLLNGPDGDAVLTERIELKPDFARPSGQLVENLRIGALGVGGGDRLAQLPG